MRLLAVLTGLPLTALQWFSIIFWIVRGVWWPFIVWLLAAIPLGVLWSRYYFRHVKYICPECHKIFRPTLREVFFLQITRRQPAGSPAPPAVTRAFVSKSGEVRKHERV